MLHYLLAMAPPPDQQGGGGMVSTLIMFGAIFAIFYFMIIRPQQKRQKERDKLLNSLKKGDQVITNGGMHATVWALDEKTVTLHVGENIKLKFERSAIATVVATKTEEPAKN